MVLTKDVNTLFQTHSIDEVNEIEKEIRGQIEKKKEELRFTVGERYRDLINAADTIQEMKNEMGEVFTGITNLREVCSSYETSESSNVVAQHKSEESPSLAFYSLATQMDLLVDTPEKIWSALDSRDYLKATELYLLSHHIVNTSLNINAGTQESLTSLTGATDVYASFPILHHQWAAISHFKSSILKGAKNSLKDTKLPDKVLSESLCSICLLENLSPRQVFTEFLLARKAKMQDVFHSSQYAMSVKKQTCEIAHAVKLTIEQIITLFYSDEQNEGAPQPLFYETLLLITDEKNAKHRKALDLFGHDRDVKTIVPYLPENVSGFVPKLRTLPVPITLSYLRTHALEWLERCVEDVGRGVETLLSFINNVKGLGIICDAVFDLLSCQHSNNEDIIAWDDAANTCFGKSLSIWNDVFRPLFVARIQTIIQNHFETCFNDLISNHAAMLESLTDTGVTETCWDHNLTSFMWHDFPHDFLNLVQSKRNDEENFLSMKTNCHTPTMKRLCHDFNESLEKIMDDVSHFLYVKETLEVQQQHSTIKMEVEKLLLEVSDLKHKPPFDKYADCCLFQEALSQVLTHHLNRFSEHLHRITKELESCIKICNNGSEDCTMLIDKVAFTGRFSHAICDLCPCIEKIIDYESIKKKPRVKRSSSLSFQKKSASFLKVGEDLRKETEYSFGVWKTWLCGVCEEMIKTTLGSEDNYGLLSTTNWCEVAIEEESEVGEKIHSIIKVPNQLSFYLTSLLFRIVEEYLRVGAVILDSQTKFKYKIDIASTIVECHAKFANTFVMGECFQYQVLQLIFDLKFIRKLFGATSTSHIEAVAELHIKLQKVLAGLERFVDPFDLDVFTPHINNYVDRHLQRTILMYEPISNVDKMTLKSSVSQQHQTNQESPNVLPMVTNPPRFMQLPLTDHTKESELIETISVGYDECCSSLYTHKSLLMSQLWTE